MKCCGFPHDAVTGHENCGCPPNCPGESNIYRLITILAIVLGLFAGATAHIWYPGSVPPSAASED